MISDRVMRAITVGTFGAIVQNIFIFLVHKAGLVKVDYEDYAEMLFFSKLTPGFWPGFFGLVGHFIWDIFLGIVFVYIIKLTSSRHCILKGIFFGMFMWYVIKVTMTLFRVPVFNNPTPQTVGIYLIGSILYGVAIASGLRLLEKTPAVRK